jgi:hypothetical protein
VPKPVVVPLKPLTSWSFSRYSDYKQCPAKFKYKHLQKLPEPKGEALERGAAIHTMAEQYIKGVLRKLPAELSSFSDEFKELRKLYKTSPQLTVVEDNWALTSDWTQTEWDNWSRCWVRIKLDFAQRKAGGVMSIRDWKTGKLRVELHEEYLEQLELYALAALLLHEDVTEVRPELDYLDLGVVYPEEPLVYTRADIPRLKKVWEQRVRPMFNDRQFAPRVNSKCNWCHFRKANGGPCKF